MTLTTRDDCLEENLEFGFEEAARVKLTRCRNWSSCDSVESRISSDARQPATQRVCFCFSNKVHALFSRACDPTKTCRIMDILAAEVDRVVFTPYPTQLKVG